MLVSLNEIKKYVNLDGITPEEIACKITSAGIEVDSYKPLACATNLVIGHIFNVKSILNLIIYILLKLILETMYLILFVALQTVAMT